jgi:hypothetical protein
MVVHSTSDEHPDGHQPIPDLQRDGSRPGWKNRWEKARQGWREDRHDRRIRHVSHLGITGTGRTPRQARQ